MDRVLAGKTSEFTGKEANGSPDSTSAQRFARGYLQALLVKALPKKKLAESTRKYMKKLQYRSSEGEPAPGFPDGDLATIFLVKRERMQSISKDSRRSATWFEPFETHSEAAEDPDIAAAPGAKDEAAVSKSGPIVSLQDSYALHFGQSPPRYNAILREVQKARAAAERQDQERRSRQAHRQGDTPACACVTHE